MRLTTGIVEGSALFLAASGAFFVMMAPPSLDWLTLSVILGQSSVISICCIVSFYYNELYDFRVVRNLLEFVSRLGRALLLAICLCLLVYLILQHLNDRLVVRWANLIPVTLLAAAIVLPIRAAAYVIMRAQAFSECVLLIGSSALASRILDEIYTQPHLRYSLLRITESEMIGDEIDRHHPPVGSLRSLAKLIDEVQPDRIITAVGERRGRLNIEDLLNARTSGVIVEDGVEAYERLSGKVAIESLAPSVLIFSEAFSPKRFYSVVQRLLSLTIAGVGLLCASPLLGAIAIGIRLDSPGPILFVQERAGLHGRLFRLYKFRTMRPSAQSPESVWERDDVTRITRVGRWLRKLRLDELPQFWNILKGDMNFVGPRPEMAENVAVMSREIPFYNLRHSIRPGITGWAQVRHGYSVDRSDVMEKIRYDLYYIKNMSFGLDVRILLDTVKVVFFGRGAR